MQNKFTRLFICDPWLAMGVAIILLWSVVVGVQLNLQKGLDQKYALALKDQALVSRIKDLERSLKTSEDGSSRKMVKNGFSFEGYLTEGSDYLAIIDANVYRVGDRIRDYQVDKIGQDVVILKHTQTGEQEILPLNIPHS